MFTYAQKVEILLENAKAYYNKGHDIQYDQYAMDRTLRITPRNTRFAPPEMANEQHMLFLDCSTFTYAVYYNTFGYQLESNLTWQIPHMLKPCVYEKTFTREETREEKLAIREEILSHLQPGDIINKRRLTGSGHVMLYMGDGKIIHSYSDKMPNSYQYTDLREAIYDHGTIHIEPIDKVVDVDAEKVTVFAKDIDSMQIFRPVELMGDPTPAAISRAGKSKDLILSVLTSHPLGKITWTGDTVTYTLTVENIGSQPRNVDVSVTETQELTLAEGERACAFQVLPGQKVQKSYQFVFNGSSAPVSPAPAFVANDITVFAEPVRVARSVEKSVRDAVVMQVINAKGPLYDRVVSAYQKAGITLPQNPFDLLFPCFRLFDSQAGYVLWRFPQAPQCDLSLYSYFGGTGVITPELSADPECRVRKVRAEHLQTGDLVMISDDHEFSKTHCLFVTGDGILTQFDGEEIALIPNGEEANKLIETLPGRFCFIVFRPEQQADHSPEPIRY